MGTTVSPVSWRGRLIYARITRCLQNFVEEKSNGKNAHSFGYATR
jgi:hypothetical protein